MRRFQCPYFTSVWRLWAVALDMDAAPHARYGAAVTAAWLVGRGGRLHREVWETLALPCWTSQVEETWRQASCRALCFAAMDTGGHYAPAAEFHYHSGSLWAGART